MTLYGKCQVIVSISIGFAVCLNAFGEPVFRSQDLSEYESFCDGFPRTLLFRKGSIVNWHERGVLDHHLGMFDADTRKYVGEETAFRQDWIDIMSAFKKRHPRKLSLIHLNGEARGVYRKEGHKYFPGHWIFYPGEILNHDLSAQDQVIRVSTTVTFSQRTYQRRERGKLTEELFPPVIIVPLQPDGSKKWSMSEYASILKINEEKKEITLERGQYFSKAREFHASQAYIAPIHCEYWGAGTMWTLNLSSKCPPDPQGRTAVDIWLEEIKQWCGAGGPAEHVDGIGFDVIFFKAKRDTWDIDADGKTDAGVAESGEDFNTRGQYRMLKRLRDQMGSDFILTSDAWDHKMQRAVGIFNGMENEGLCMYNDGWRKIAQTINTQRYWAEQGNAKYNYSYITSKLRHPEDMKIADQLYRMGLGTACALGVSYTDASIPKRKDGLPMIPEMHQGRANTSNWLGQPVGEMVMLPKNAADILNGNGVPFSKSAMEDLETENCKITLHSDGSLLIEGTSENPYQEMEVTLRGLKVPEGDLTVFFEALALEPLTGYDPGDRIPRHITVHADGMPEDPPDQMGGRPMYNDIMALMGTGGWQENCAHFRHAGAGTGTIDMTLRIEHQGACKIRNLTAHNAPMGFVREFENGVVLVNASQAEVEFELATLFPRAQSTGLWRMKAAPEDYLPGPATTRMLDIHNGRKLDSPYIKLPPLEGLYLCKSPQ
ncbi:hypothetical protein ACFL6U_24350 [Planctomycetota bacterium]